MYTQTEMTAELITIGDELNRGEITDTNAAWMAEQLTALGCDVRYRTGVNDRQDDMSQAIHRAAQRARLVVVSGGLGPTADDLTVDVVAALCGTVAEEEPAHRARMEERFRKRGFAMTPNNLRQVRIPKGAQVLENHAGLAPGFVVRDIPTLGSAHLCFLPGVPREMKPIFESQVVPLVRSLLSIEGVRATRRTYRVIGMGESHVDHILDDLLSTIPAPLQGGRTTVHYRLAFPEILVTVVCFGRDGVDPDLVLAHLDQEIRQRLGGALYSEGTADLPVVVGEKLKERGETLAVAESCTGGMIGALLTAIPGSSAYFMGGVISYDNAVKRDLLGVTEDVLLSHGAVSEACVRQMAEGVRTRLGTTYGIAVSGLAGPDGGSADKPVGTVYFAVACPGETVTRKVFWPGDREQVRRIAACAALNLLHKQLCPDRKARPIKGEFYDRLDSFSPPQARKDVV